MIGALIVLLVMAIGVTVWRYGSAVNSQQVALQEGQVEVAVQEARAALAAKGGLVDAYGGDKDPADLRAIGGVEKDFRSSLTEAADLLDDDEERERVTGFLDAERALDRMFAERVVPVAASSRSEARRAQLIALVAGGLALVLAVMVGAYSSRLVRRLFGRIEGQLQQIDRQVERIEQIRATAADLANAAGAMRAAAGQTASATSEQSAAIAEAAS